MDLPRIIPHVDPRAFAERTREMLIARECENCLILGLTRDSIDSTAINPDLLMLTVESQGKVVGALIQTRPQNVCVSRIDPGHLDPLCRYLLKMNHPINGAFGPVETVDPISEIWCRLTGRRRRQQAAMRVFQLDSPQPPRPVSGRLIVAAQDHLDRAAEWEEAFSREIAEPATDPRAAAQRIIGQGQLFFWEDAGEIRAMTGVAGPTPNGIRINRVYTPPELRGRGYASNAVAAVSQRMLDEGRRFCFLFTDLSNPTSNRIYQNLGYHPAGDFRQWSIESAGNT